MNNPPNPAVTVTQADELRALIAKATDEDLTDGGRYFDETYTDLTRCWHGEIGEYQQRGDGPLIEWLWNRRNEIADLYAARQSIPVAAGVGEGLREALTPSDAQVEHVAKALYDAAHAGLSNCYAWDDAWEAYQEARRGRYYRDAKAAIPAVIAALAARPPEDLSTPDALLLGGDAMREKG